MKRQIPRGVPRVFPFIRHGNDVGIVKMRPVMVAASVARGIGFRLGGIACEPAAAIVVVALLAPQQAGERLALPAASVLTLLRIDASRVKVVRFFDALIKNLLESRSEELQRAGVVGRKILIGQAPPK